MDIEGWRLKIDELDRQIVLLISERAAAAQEIGRLKRATDLPVYEPNRERVIFGRTIPDRCRTSSWCTFTSALWT